MPVPAAVTAGGGEAALCSGCTREQARVRWAEGLGAVGVFGWSLLCRAVFLQAVGGGVCCLTSYLRRSGDAVPLQPGLPAGWATAAGDSLQWPGGGPGVHGPGQHAERVWQGLAGG